ncbi:DUF6680 family protein [Bradyrhizobium sp. 153]|uniref:DUF6680 family protein n=1 Tax=Bradyrhizobium sp. 153 TaxID=2782627 RepID=UPI001FFB3911|nr:DUF6680 family protein [Bradyrhizobium sp. 153]MCK1669400.1 hypothetical protein [Bradyrhizobium sp. 153]
MTWAEIIAVAALVVSIASAAFAFFAPIRAERLKRETTQRERELNCFSILMSERGRWGSANMLAALNAVKVIFRDNHDILDKWFICYSKVGTPDGSVDHYNELLAAIGRHVGLPMRREDLDNFFTNPLEQRETAIRQAQVHRAFAELSANTLPALPGEG